MQLRFLKVETLLNNAFKQTRYKEAIDITLTDVYYVKHSWYI